MLFTQPLFLFALFSLTIPVLIHFFNFRKYRKLYFSNVNFLREIEQETRKQSKLKQLLILAARLLALAALVIAFAQPYIPHAETRSPNATQQVVCIYIDNSFSMETVGSEGTLLEASKVRASEVAAAYSPTDLFLILTNDFEGRHQHLIHQEDLRKLIGEIQPSPAVRSLAEIINRINDVVQDKKGPTDAYIISDFQKTTMSLQNARPDSLINWFLIPLAGAKINNLYIDSLYFSSPVHLPSQTARLHVRIRNIAEEPLEKIPLKLTINDVQKSLSGFSIEGNSTREIILSYTENDGGIQSGVVELTDFPVVYDDRFYFSYAVNRSVRIACINQDEPNRYINSLFTGDSSFTFNSYNANQIDFSSLATHSAIILNGLPEISSGLAMELQKIVESGGTLVVFPPPGGSVETLNNMLKTMSVGGFGPIDTSRQRVTGINLQNELYFDVFENTGSGQPKLPVNPDLPVAEKHYKPLEKPGENIRETLLTLAYDDPFLSNYRAGKGNVFLFYSCLDPTWSNLPRHVIFVPTLYRIALLSTPTQALYYQTGTDETIEIQPGSAAEPEMIRLKGIQSGDEIVPGIRKVGSRVTINTRNQITQPGLFTVKDGNKTLAGLAFNVDRRESELACFSPGELKDMAGRLAPVSINVINERKHTLTQEIKMIKQGTPLWKIFIVISLLFILAEILLIRFLPFANRTQRSETAS